MSASSGSKRSDLPLHAALLLLLAGPSPSSLVPPSGSAFVVPTLLCRFPSREDQSIRRARLSNIGGSGSGFRSSDSDRCGSSTGSGAVGGHRTSFAGPMVESSSTVMKIATRVPRTAGGSGNCRYLPR
ncbi:hypothetical protein EV714DRAFT_278097 [Schizophyllum commune]